MCLHRQRSTAISFVRFSKGRRSYSRSVSASSVRLPNMMSSVWRTSSPSFFKTERWCSICRMNTRRIDTLTEPTSWQFWTPSILSMSARWSPMPIERGSLPTVKLTSKPPSRSMKSGGTIWTLCLTFHVSIISRLTQVGSKGRTLHLLKENAKPVPKQKKRRKINLLDLPQAVHSPAMEEEK